MSRRIIGTRIVGAAIRNGVRALPVSTISAAPADYDEAALVEPKNPDVADARAWAWATCPDARFRDGKRALETAESLCKSQENNPRYTATLAASCAEVDDFDAAVRRQTQSNTLETDEEERAEGEARLMLHRGGKPFRDDTP